MTTPDTPIRKRQRFLDAGVDQAGWLSQQRSPLTEGDTQMRAMNGTERRRDDMYYMSDGSCVLLVEETLFNVHRTMLSRDGSSFCTMFSLPQGDREPEGSSDENPIILGSDTVVEFKHFLWALYALPHELAVVHSIEADLTQLINIARVSNKYCFRSIETWALDAIQEYISHTPSPILKLLPTNNQRTLMTDTGKNIDGANTILVSAPQQQENTAQLTRLIRLAQMCNHERLLSAIIEILRHVMSQGIQDVYVVMILADELSLRELQGAAYLRVIQNGVFRRCLRSESEGSSKRNWGEGDIDDDGCLLVTAAQQQRLLLGYYRLTILWEQLRASPLDIDHVPSCSVTRQQQRCIQSWLEFWKEGCRCEAVQNLGPADVIGRLRAFHKEFDRWGSAAYMHHDCRIAAKRCVQERIKTIETSLSVYFVDDME